MFESQESFEPPIDSRLEPTELKLFEQSDEQKSSPESPHSENGSDRLDSESGKSRNNIFRSFVVPIVLFLASFFHFPLLSSF